MKDQTGGKSAQWHSARQYVDLPAKEKQRGQHALSSLSDTGVRTLGRQLPGSIIDSGVKGFSIRVDDAHVIHMSGELDIATVPQLHRVIVAERATEADHLVFDLRDVEFCDASIIAELVLATTDVSVTLLNPSRFLIRLLQLVNVEEFFMVTMG